MRESSGFVKGLKDGLPVGIGYISVAFAFGVKVLDGGLPIWSAIFISATNITSAGQYAGLGLMIVGAPIMEIILTQVIINIRYALMSISIAQKSDKSITNLHKIIIGFFITDEIFAIVCGNKEDANRRYMYGLGAIGVSCWVLGTVLGAVAGSVLPNMVRDAIGIALYGMFIAIIIPPARYSHAIKVAVGLSALMSCAFKYIPVINGLSSGFVIMICAIVVSTVCAKFFPVKQGGSN